MNRLLLTLLAMIALMAFAPGCDVAGSRGPTSDQRAEAQQVEQEFESVRREAEQFIQQHAGSADSSVQSSIEMLRTELESAEDSVESLHNAPRNQFEDYKSAAENNIRGVQRLVESMRDSM